MLGTKDKPVLWVRCLPFIEEGIIGVYDPTNTSPYQPNDVLNVTNIFGRDIVSDCKIIKYSKEVLSEMVCGIDKINRPIYFVSWELVKALNIDWDGDTIVILNKRGC